MNLSEIFYSLQGEGGRVGQPSIFIRLQGCSMQNACFESGIQCDTEFESGTLRAAKEIADTVASLMPEPRAVILTGGEPLLAYDGALHDALRAVGVKTIACETNGSTKPKAPIDYVACSPKVAEHVVAKNFPHGVNELRYVRHVGQAIPVPFNVAQTYPLSPMFDGDKLNRENFEWCVKLVKEHPEWRLSTQLHKAWQVR